MLDRRVIITAMLCFTAMTAQSSPWIGTTDKSLHYDLRLLAEQGLLDMAVTTYPVPWKGIGEQLNALQTEQLDAPAALAVARLKHYLFKMQSGSSSWLSAQATTSPARFTDFNGAPDEDYSIGLNKDIIAGRWAFKVAANYSQQHGSHFDNSYIAYQFDNWNVRLGAIDQWWGPGNAASLILTDNARPTPSIALSRSSAMASESPWLSWMGPWYLTTQMGVLESDRHVPNTKLWSSRFNLRPLEGLEIGFNWVAMWGGDGYGNGFSDFIDVITSQVECANGEQDCDPALNTKIGNQLAGYDVQYSFSVADLPLSIYAQQIGEDSVDNYKVTDKATLAGISWQGLGGRWFIEHADTNVSCGGRNSTTTNCYYEHGTYKSGYRRYGRAIGSSYDSDARVVSLGFDRRFAHGGAWQVRLHHAELNKDKSRPSPLLLGEQESLIQLNTEYQYPLKQWLLTLGTQLVRTKVNDSDTEWDNSVFMKARYYLP